MKREIPVWILDIACIVSLSYAILAGSWISAAISVVSFVLMSALLMYPIKRE